MYAKAQESARCPLTEGMINRIIEASVRHISPDDRDYFTVRQDGTARVYSVYAHLGDRVLTWESRGNGANDDKDKESSVVCAMIRAYGQVPLDYASAPAANTVEAATDNLGPERAGTSVTNFVSAKPVANLETTVREVTNWDFINITPPLPVVPGLGYSRRV